MKQPTAIRQVFVTADRTPNGFVNPVRRLGAKLPGDGIDRIHVRAEVYMAIMEREGIQYLERR